MRYSSNPAADTVIQLGGLMSVVAVGATHAAEAARNAALEAREASVFQSYADALEQAHAYAYEVQAIAEAAISRVRALEAEVADLRAACRQRQDALDRMRSVA